MFFPTEIIFAPTDSCNLHCPHCFVSRSPQKLDISKAKTFIQSCIEYTKNNQQPLGNIEKVGFTGGEPFLNLDFLEEIIKFTVSNDLLFDQIMTNGDWWKTQEDLYQKLQQLYNAGYDGKIGLSWDSFHGQSIQRIETFISAVQQIFGSDALNIQIVSGGESLPLAPAGSLHQVLQQAQDKAQEQPSSATPSSGENPRNAPFTIPEYLDTHHPEIHYYILPQTFQSQDPQAWKAKKWFKEDYCQGPGQILFIHPDGNIAPCCGFANENPALFIGTIDNSFEEVLKKAGSNKMIDICYNTGLSKYKKQLKKAKIKLPGKTADICSFCDFVCKFN